MKDSAEGSPPFERPPSSSFVSLERRSGRDARVLYLNFVAMAVYFSANHGSVTSVIALASSFDATLGSYSVGMLYACYVLTAMFAGQYIIEASSAKKVLVGSLALYAVYVASYLVAVIWPGAAWPAVLFGAAVGGVGAGTLWVAQGAYFKVNASRYALATKGATSEEEASGLLSSTFACCYLGLEVALKLTGSLVAKYGAESGKYTVYAIYAVVAVVCTAMMTTVLDMDPAVAAAEREEAEAAERRAGGEATGGSDGAAATASGGAALPPPPPLKGCDKVTAAVRLLLRNPKCALMAPTNVAFGFAGAFITSYIQGSVVSPIKDGTDDDESRSHHESQVLLYSSLAVGVATALAAPGFGFHYLRQRAGSPPVMLIGAACFAFVALQALTLANGDEDGSAALRSSLWLLYVVYGAGRSVWESTVKAIFADFFSTEDSPAAFANIILQYGIASVFAFFAFPDFDATTKELLLLFTAALGFLSYFTAHVLHTREKKAAAYRELESPAGGGDAGFA
jgi:hypothetical protein